MPKLFDDDANLLEKRYIYYGQDDDSIYTKRGKQKLLREENIVFVGGVHAFKIIPRDKIGYLLELWSEDDECLSNTDVAFDEGWLKDLKKLIVAVEKKLKEQHAKTE